MAAAHRTIDDAKGALRACADARAATRPDVVGRLHINLVVSSEGKATEVRVSALELRDDDSALDRCAKGVIQIPEKILQALETEKGKLVMVKPIIE